MNELFAGAPHSQPIEVSLRKRKGTTEWLPMHATESGLLVVDTAIDRLVTYRSNRTIRGLGGASVSHLLLDTQANFTGCEPKVLALPVGEDDAPLADAPTLDLRMRGWREVSMMVYPVLDPPTIETRINAEGFMDLQFVKR